MAVEDWMQAGLPSDWSGRNGGRSSPGTAHVRLSPAGRGREPNTRVATAWAAAAFASRLEVPEGAERPTQVVPRTYAVQRWAACEHSRAGMARASGVAHPARLLVIVVEASHQYHGRSKGKNQTAQRRG